MLETETVEEEEVEYEAHDFFIHRYDSETPWQLRAHADTTGRFHSYAEASHALEDRQHPEYLHIEERTEWVPIASDASV